MSELATLGIDLAKSVFQIHGVDENGVVLVRRQLRRSQLLAFFQQLPRCLVGIEACAGAHDWGRRLEEIGHDVRLMPRNPGTAPSKGRRGSAKRRPNGPFGAGSQRDALTRQTTTSHQGT